MIRKLEQGDTEHERPSKRIKIEQPTVEANEDVADNYVSEPSCVEDQLLPSHVLLDIPPVTSDGFVFRVQENSVGISEYVGRNIPKIDGIIKQRFTDFLVNEVDLDGQVVHIKSLAMAEPAGVAASAIVDEPIVADDTVHGVESGSPFNSAGIRDNAVDSHPAAGEDLPEANIVEAEPWPEHFSALLKPFLSEDAIDQVKKMYLEGPVPPTEGLNEPVQAVKSTDRGGPGKAGNRGRGRRGGETERERKDGRRVISDPISSKATRTALHQAIRKLFDGKLESQTDTSTLAPDEGSRIIIKWSGGHGDQSDRGYRRERAPRGTYPSYIHFTLQKTNRDTQDALGHLSRILHVNVKALSVAGTKDKRGVTVQRVSLRRGNKTAEDVWKLANGQGGQKSLENALTQRGERGVRIADINYRKSGLELGMLKGNSFLITLRNVQVDSSRTLDLALNTLKGKGFINYYGMQRFGTACVPTHSIGLALLKSDWHRAISLILQMRPGEHPDVAAARQAWLIDHDLNKALELMPRRVVAERCILESYKKQGGETRNAMGTLSTIPRNLRLMYVHAYQSYVWNAIVSERIRTSGSDNPVPGDLVFDDDRTGEADLEADGVTMAADNKPEADTAMTRSEHKAKRPYVAPRVKTLTADDIEKYTIFDVIMPLPGNDVAFPGGKLGERYKAFLRMDGLDPDNLVRKQKEYSLSGSYRKILHLPKELSWRILRYTDPDVPLAQSDEDKLLGFDPPAVVEDGKFVALQINMILGTAAYATMALREITKADTSSHFQTNLTLASEDQKFRGVMCQVEGKDDNEMKALP